MLATNSWLSLHPSAYQVIQFEPVKVIRGSSASTEHHDHHDHQFMHRHRSHHQTTNTRIPLPGSWWKVPDGGKECSFSPVATLHKISTAAVPGMRNAATRQRPPNNPVFTSFHSSHNSDVYLVWSTQRNFLGSHKWSRDGLLIGSSVSCIYY